MITSNIIQSFFWGKTEVSDPAAVPVKVKDVKRYAKQPFNASMRAFVLSLAEVREARCKELRVMERAQKAASIRVRDERLRETQDRMQENIARLCALRLAETASRQRIKLEEIRQKGGPWVCSITVFGHLINSRKKQRCNE